MHRQQTRLRFYEFAARIFPRRSYGFKIFVLAFLCTHVPLWSLCVYMALQAGALSWALLGVATAGTLAGTLALLAGLHRLLQPVLLTGETLHAYYQERRAPALPRTFTDEAGRLMADVARAIDRFEIARRELEQQVRHDPLTGLYNRRAAEEKLRAVADLVEQGDEWRIALLDVDGLGGINGRFGRQIGDGVLRDLAARAGLATSDGCPRSWVARWGGDEFLAAFAGKERDCLRRLQRLLDRCRMKGPGDTYVSLSAGLTRLREGEPLEIILQRADFALYRAKSGGRDRFETADANSAPQPS
ncbi:MAG: diguanylate cyclase [Acidobacteria bacterium]|nr:diguanylate cyclase [Acidobacteriota bacterium]